VEEAQVHLRTGAQAQARVQEQRAHADERIPGSLSGASSPGAPGKAVHTHEEEMPRVVISRRQAIACGLFVLAVVAFFYFVLPKLAGVGETLRHLEHGDLWWIAAGVVLELLSFAGYVVLFRAVFVVDRSRSRGPRSGGSLGGPSSPGSPDGTGQLGLQDASGTPNPIGWRESYQITMAGLAATRLFATAGAGGIALTAWALRRSGMEPRLVACRMVAFMVLLYAVYAGSMLIDGIGLGTGLFPGGGSFALTILPAIAAAVLICVVGAMALLPGDIERRLGRWASHSGRLAHWIARAATVPALAASGVRTAIELIRERDPGLLGAVAWWGFDIAVLWAMFHAFGTPPPFTVIWMAYFIGMLGNLLPLPGGLGGVEGGMIGAFAAFGVSFDLAVLAVLSYRGISFWLPTIPGAIAYFQLRRTVARWRSEQGERRISAPARAGAVEEAGAGTGTAGALQGS
jgi:putative heme transporter